VVGTTRACALTGRSKATHYRAMGGALHGPPAPRPSLCTPSATRSGQRSWPCCGRPPSPTLPSPRCGPCCSTAGRSWPASPPRTGSYVSAASTVTDGASAPTRPRRSASPRRPPTAAGLVVGHHETARARSRRIVRQLRDHRHRQPLRVGWTVEISEDSTIGKALIAEAIARQSADRGQLTLHAGRGTSMTSKTATQLLEGLGATRTHSRPHVSLSTGQCGGETRAPARGVRSVRRIGARLGHTLALDQHLEPQRPRMADVGGHLRPGWTALPSRTGSGAGEGSDPKAQSWASPDQVTSPPTPRLRRPTPASAGRSG